jgi:hypothetical protein
MYGRAVQLAAYGPSVGFARLARVSLYPNIFLPFKNKDG